MDMMDGNDTKSESRDSCFCTFAVTGPKPWFQEIFLCRTCTTTDAATNDAACFCGACARICHRCHDVRYLGMGMSYCDCSKQGGCCQLEEVSRTVAGRFQIQGGISVPEQETNKKHDDYVRDVYMIDQIALGSQCHSRLVHEAVQLVGHSKETFWLDKDPDTSTATPLLLERLAWSMLQNHSKVYGLNAESCGVEWWIQIKDVATSIPFRFDQIMPNVSGPRNEAIDLHYDKDEVLAESFGLGVFPTLSTVTYLTDSFHAPPTLVFAHRYDEGDDCMIPDMLLSRPRLGKHLVFDGRLLHGAPHHLALRPLTKNIPEPSSDQSVRMTFVVNIWQHHSPSGVHALPDSIRAAIQESVPSNDSSTELSKWTFERSSCEQFELEDEQHLPRQLQGRIALPFVGKSTTWGNDDDESADGMQVITFPPPAMHCSTLLVKFGPGLQAYLDANENYSAADIEKEKEEAYV